MSVRIISWLRAQAPFRLSRRYTLPSHNTTSPDLSSRRRAESVGAVVVALLRVFARRMLKINAVGPTNDAFGASIAEIGSFTRAPACRIYIKRSAIMSLRALEKLAPLIRKVTVWSGIDDVDKGAIRGGIAPAARHPAARALKAIRRGA